MSLVLVDSNVILDVLTEDPKWFAWSSQKISTYVDRGVLAINPIIYAEISVSFKKIEDLEATLLPGFFTKLDFPGKLLFLQENAF